MKLGRPTITSSYIVKSLLNDGICFFSLTKTVWTVPEHTAELDHKKGEQGSEEMVEDNPIRHMVVSVEERNGRCFGDESKSIHVVKGTYLSTLFLV